MLEYECNFLMSFIFADVFKFIIKLNTDCLKVTFHATSPLFIFIDNPYKTVVVCDGKIYKNPFSYTSLYILNLKTVIFVNKNRVVLSIYKNMQIHLISLANRFSGCTVY